MQGVKRLLILGGSPFQMPLIERAKECGLYVITCDYLPENPGHKLADEYHNVSTTDKEAVLSLARSLKIDAITSLSSDPAVPTVAYVAKEMDLPGPSPSSIQALTEKDNFRALMREAGMNAPDFFTVTSTTIPKAADPNYRYIVKPVDSSGSKGITVSDGTAESLLNCIDYAFRFSRNGRCLIESYIEGKQIHGDGFLVNGRLIYCYLGDHYFYTDTNSFIPISTRWPASVSDDVLMSTAQQVELISMSSGYLDGPVNIEARINGAGKPFIIEVGPRNGGNFVPIIQHKLTGFDFVNAAISLAIGERDIQINEKRNGVGAHYIIHSKEHGVLKDVFFSPEAKRFSFFRYIMKSFGSAINPYTGSNETLGVCLFEFEDRDQSKVFFENIQKHIKVIVS